MCGRYYCEPKTEYEVEKDLGFEKGAVSLVMGDITPSMSSSVICAKRGDEDKRIIASTMFWGITGKDKKLVINARSESVLDKTMFSESINHRRLVIPASGFYEWDKEKNKVSFFRGDKKPIYLAGFYMLSENKDSFVILTTAANDSMIKVHDRMPLMIEKDAVKYWIFDNSAAKDMLQMKMPLLECHTDYEQLSLF